MGSEMCIRDRYRRGGFLNLGWLSSHGVSQCPCSSISIGVRNDSVYSSDPVTDESDQIEGNITRRLKTTTHHGAQRFMVFPTPLRAAGKDPGCAVGEVIGVERPWRPDRSGSSPVALPIR